MSRNSCIYQAQKDLTFVVSILNVNIIIYFDIYH